MTSSGSARTSARRALRDLDAAVHHHAAVAERADGIHHVFDNEDGTAFATQLFDQRYACFQLRSG